MVYVLDLADDISLDVICLGRPPKRVRYFSLKVRFNWRVIRVGLDM